MKLRVGGGWRKTLPYFKQTSVWRKGEHVFSKLGGQWRDVSEAGLPTIFTLEILPMRFYTYGERCAYVSFFSEKGQVSQDRFNIRDPSKIITTIEWGSNDVGYPGGAWKWLTFTVDSPLPDYVWPQLAWFNDIPLHFVSVGVTTPGGTTTRVWYRSYTNLPNDTTRWHKISI